MRALSSVTRWSRGETEPGGAITRCWCGSIAPAAVVVVSRGTVNSATLLLRSEPADSSGMLGRHYMAHLNSGAIALSQTPNETTRELISR